MDLLLHYLLNWEGSCLIFERRNLLRLLLTEFLVVRGSKVNQQVLDLLLGGAVGLDVWRHLFLVLIVYVSTSLQQELTHFEVVFLDGVVEGCLLVLINKVRIRPILNHEVGSLKMPLFGYVEEWSLTVGVDMVDVTSVVDEEFEQATLAFTSCVVQRRLLEEVDIIDQATLF
jgi:hypothetical protein